MASLGTSLLVPSVAELAKETLSVVPQRYVREDQDHPFISDTTSLPEVPVIDFSNLLSEDSAELDKFHSACQEWGFFQLAKHGVRSTLLEKVKVESEEFLKMPKEQKQKYWQKDGELEGFGQTFVVSEEQKLDWADMFYMITLPHHIRKPHLFPHLPLPFRDTLEEYSKELKDLAIKIMNVMVKTLGIESNAMKGMLGEGNQAMRMNYYPPCPQPELVMGLNPHSDVGGITILLHVNEVEGLQIRKDGIWIPVKPVPGAFTINIGDAMEIITNGIYKSIEHRATVNASKERLSIATFYGPKLDDEIGPIPSLITPQTPALFGKISFADYLKGYFSRELHGKSYLEVLRIQSGNHHQSG